MKARSKKLQKIVDTEHVLCDSNATHGNTKYINMRTKTLLCLAALTAGVATSMAQSNVYSLNIVGYVTVTNNPGFSIIANPLSATNNNIPSLFSDAPAFTKILRFQGGLYVQAINDPDDGWVGAAISTPLAPGEGFFIQVGSQYVKTFVGEVVLNSTNSVPSGFSMKSSVIPQAGLLQTDLLYPAASFDKVLRWNFAGQLYDQFILDPDDGWVPSQPNVRVAEGYFIQTGVAKNWIRNFAVGP